MSVDDLKAIGDRTPSTDARFGMRALLIAMACLALAMTLFGFVVRKLPDPMQLQAVATLLVVAVVLVGCVAYVARSRRRLERLAGTPRFVLAPHSYLLPRAPQVLARITGIVAILFGALSLGGIGVLAWREPSRHVTPSLAWNLFWSLSACSFGISALWWNRGTRLCDGGLLQHNKFLAWTKIQRYYWDGCYRDVLVLDTWIAVRVPVETREAVESYVHERIEEAKKTNEDGKTCNMTA